VTRHAALFKSAPVLTRLVLSDSVLPSQRSFLSSISTMAAPAASGSKPWHAWPADLPSMSECRNTPEFHRLKDPARIKEMHTEVNQTEKKQWKRWHSYEVVISSVIVSERLSSCFLSLCALCLLDSWSGAGGCSQQVPGSRQERHLAEGRHFSRFRSI
jgi:hypothetical protein